MRVRVVTAFVEREGRVLVVRRSDRVRTYPGRWAGISGYVNASELPEDAALREVREETQLRARITCAGLPIDVDDGDLKWRVHPFLAATMGGAPQLDWEAVEARWIHPAEVGKLEAVPALVESLARVWDPVQEVPAALRHAARAIRDDRLRGATELARAAWELAARAPEQAERVAALRPTMAAVVAAARAAGRGEKWKPRTDAATAAAAAVMQPGSRVVTISRSSTLLAAFAQVSSPLEIVVAESAPGFEGRATADAIARAGHQVELVPDSEAPFAVRTADLVIVGADAITRRGDVINKAGTLPLALAARQYRVPFYAAADDSKRWDDDVPPPLEAHFDVTPAELVTSVLGLGA
jgi:8-oxo-dGTP pyrophosphatase MutT (NUDIX family)